MKKIWLIGSICLFLLIACDNGKSPLSQNKQVSSTAKAPISEENTEKNFKEEKYFSSLNNKWLPYLIAYPHTLKPQAILIYMHGAGGGMEQGMSETLYKGNFRKLKNLLSAELNYIYVTPSTSDFEKSGGQDLNDLAKKLNAQYPNIPLYLAGASAGGRTVYYALQNTDNIFSGVILMCPAVGENLIKQSTPNHQKIPFWVVQGDSDQSVSPQTTDQLVTKLKQNKMAVTYKKIPGDHNAPVEQIDWTEALRFLAKQK